MKIDFKKLPLRDGVGIVVLNKKNKVFVAKRIDNPKNFWQMPQGGKDESENYYEAAIRELQEETSIKNVTLIKKFNGSDDEINVNTPKPEFLDWKWVEIDQLIDVVVDFKRDVYKKVTSEIKKVITN